MKKTLTITLLALAITAKAQQTPKHVTITGKEVEKAGLKIDSAINAISDTDYPVNKFKQLTRTLNEAIQPLYIAYRQRMKFESDSLSNLKKGTGKP